MSRRLRDSLYAGPRSRTTLEKAARIRDAVVTPKVDGIMIRLVSDDDGIVRHTFTRNGEPAPAAFRASFRGVRTVPGAVLIAEGEAMTEWAQRTVATRGYPLMHIWDVQRLDGRDLTHEPYRARRDALMRAYVALEASDPDRPWVDDVTGRAHDPKTGRYCKTIPGAWRRILPVPTMPVHKADEAWSTWVERDGHEGLVVSRLGAPLGARGASAKVKQSDTLDCTVIGNEGGVAALMWRGHEFLVSARGRWRDLKPGAIVSVASDGFYESSIVPRFPRIKAVRYDLMPAATGMEA